jgi:hypothetical protein
MGVVNTTYTFTSTDTITSAKMNNIIDDTTFTSDAIQGTTLQVVSPGKLAVSAGGITSNELASNSVVTAKIADSNVTTAKIADANVTQAKLGMNISGNGPSFMAYGSVTTSVSNQTNTKITLDVEEYDTNSNFTSSRFTPTIAGYYQITGSVYASTPLQTLRAFVFKNGTQYRGGPHISGGNTQFQMDVNALVYLNGTTDYIELYAFHNNGGTSNIGGSTDTYMCGFLARSA